MLVRVARYYNTVKHLRFVQIVGQLRKSYILRAVPSLNAMPKCPVTRPVTLIPALDMDDTYLARFDIERLMGNEITLLHETHTIDLFTWRVEASPLWRFNLHYFEYAIALAARYCQTGEVKHYFKFKKLVTSWINKNPIGNGDGWHPYTISMRLPNWFICFDLFGQVFETDLAFRDTVYQSVYDQYRVLIKRKELWQLGNHYFENLKTILLCSLLFDEQVVFDNHIQLFLLEVDEEILPDGVHFELSIMYHKIILEDILRVAYWLRQVNKLQWKKLLPVLQRMINAGASLEKGMGKTPLFNDSGDGVAKEIAALLGAAYELFALKPLYTEDFVTSGYYKLYYEDISLMFDAGAIGPSYMSGHGHCDCLSFELSIDGKPLFVNSGTYQYQGDYRRYFRSTRAHNTLMIGNREQSECWGEHRVARRVHGVTAERNGQLFTASCVTASGERLTRMMSLSDNSLYVLDSVASMQADTVHSYLHLAPGYTVRAVEYGFDVFYRSKLICKIHTIESAPTCHVDEEVSLYSQYFGKLQHGCCIEFRYPVDSRQHGYIVYFEKRLSK